MTDYPFDFSGSGFNRFAESYKIPAAFLAIGFTFVGLCAANHRSEQTKKQIERTANQIDLTNAQIALTKAQNNFSNYYKHIEEFEKYCKDHSEKEKYSIHARKLHRIIFSKSNSSTASFKLNEEFISRIDSFIDQITSLSAAFNLNDFGARWDNAVTIDIAIVDFIKESFIYKQKADQSGVQISDKQGRIMILPSESWNTYFGDFISIIRIIDTALNFDLDYESSATVRRALSIDLSSIPRRDYKERFSLNSIP